MKFRFHGAAADQGPESVQARLACPCPRSKDEILQDGAQASGRASNPTTAWSARDSASCSGASGQPLRQNSLRRLPKINIPAGETGDQLSVGFSGEIHWDTSMPNGQPRRSLDPSRARELFGFSAQVPLREGIGRTVDWYRSQAT